MDEPLSNSDKHGKGRRIIRQREAAERQEAYDALSDSEKILKRTNWKKGGD
jgi:hypothetical protein